MNLKGKRNRYTCEHCSQSIVTIDRDEGVTPYCLLCKVTPYCKGFMQSAMYRGIWEEPTHEWRKPTPEEYATLHESVKLHVDMGGLCLHRIETIQAKIEDTGQIDGDDAFEIAYDKGYPRSIRSVLIHRFASSRQVVRAFLVANALGIPVELQT